MLLKISSIILATVLIGQCNLVHAESSQERLSVTRQTVDNFRQISVRILSAYKTPPRYIGSTTKWHLFLKKETRSTVDKQFSTIFGYKIARDGNPVKHGWELSLPVVEIDPDNCPEAAHYTDDKRGFSLPSSAEIAARCISQ